MAENDPKVHVMSQDERNDYDGMTIDETTGQPGDMPQEQSAPKFRYQGSGSRTQGSGFSIHTLGWRDLLFGNVSWTTRLAIVLGIVAVAAFLLFVALPILLTIVGVGAVVWLLMRFFFH